MRRARLSWVVLGTLWPGLAAADTGVLDFSKPGPLKSYFDLAMSVAQSYLPLALLVAVTLEALAHSPGRPRDFAAVVWRFILILFLLANYGRVFGFVLTTTQDIADRLTPADALKERDDYLDHVYNVTPGGADPPTIGGGAGGAPAASAASTTPAPPSGGSWGSGVLFDALMAILLFLGEAIVYALSKLAQILAAVFFILGPLALVAGIPRASGTAAKWFHHFVSIACWPIFSGVLLGVMTALAKQTAGKSAGTYLGNLVAALVMGLCALAAPVLSAWIVGGATQHAAEVGHAKFEALAANVSRWKARLTPRGDSSRKPPGKGTESGSPARGTGRENRVAQNQPGT